jgi:hypothetical protein
MPTTTDNQNWVSNCNNMNRSTLESSGAWGPISHVYAPGVAWFTVCPVMYDPHGYGTPSGGAIGSSGIWPLIAGGIPHNTDNSYDNGYRCLRSTFPIPPFSIPPSPTPEPLSSPPSLTPVPTITTPATTPMSAPLLRWTAVRGARYYNFQLYRNGKRIFNIWPTQPSVRLSRSWRFNGRMYRLTPGPYRWYVWPGLGRPAAHRYGPMIGRTLVITRLP